jgi:hypothetical protein
LNKVIQSVLLIIFFYSELLLISVRSSVLSWVINVSIICLFFYYVQATLLVTLRTKGLFLYFIWIFMSFLLVFVDALNNLNLEWSLNYLFIYCFQLPALSLVIFILFSDITHITIFTFFSFFVSILLFLFLKFGYIPDYKYQIVGNLSLLALIVLYSKFTLQSRWRSLISIILIFIIIASGSRQSLVGLLLYLLFSFIFYIYSKRAFRKYILVSISLISVTLFYTIKIDDIETIATQTENLDRLGLTSISRFVSNISLEENQTNLYRIESVQLLKNRFGIAPNGYMYRNEDLFLEPHNFFIELIFSYGYIASCFILLFFIYGLIKVFGSVDRKVYILLLLAFLIPSIVSSGIHAARLFLIFLLVPTLFKKIEYE